MYTIEEIFIVWKELCVKTLALTEDNLVLAGFIGMKRHRSVSMDTAACSDQTVLTSSEESYFNIFRHT